MPHYSRPVTLTEISPGVFQWLETNGNIVVKTRKEIDDEAKELAKSPHLGVYKWVSDYFIPKEY